MWLILAFAGCASFYPVAKTSEPTKPPAIQLEAVEGRSTTLVLEIAANKSVLQQLGLLEIYRVTDTGDPELIQEVILDEALKSEMLEGIEFADRDLVAETTYTYVVRGLGDGVEFLSNEWKATWRVAPPAPSDVQTSTDLGVVTLSWERDDVAVVVFRRNVLLSDSTISRVAELGSGHRTWTDTSVEPGDVFTYQVAFAVEINEWKLFGPPTEPIYVTLPAE